MIIEIKHRLTGAVILAVDTETHPRRVDLRDPNGCHPAGPWAGLKTADTLAGLDFRGADLHSASFRGADLESTDFRGAILYGADFSSASNGLTLVPAFLFGTDFREADLRDVEFDGADLSGACLRDANIEGATFEGAYSAHYMSIIRGVRMIEELIA